MAGGPFMTSGEQVTGHGMNSVWHAYHHTWDWLAQGASWPCVVAAPHSLIAPRPRIYDVIEDDGPAGVFDGLEPLVRRVTGLRQKSTQGCDVRFSRFQVLIWDYRGRIDRFKLEASSVTVGVSPKNDPSLKLIGLISGGGSRKVIKVDGPADLSESLGEALTVAKFALKSGEDIVAEVQRDLEQEAIIATLDGRTIGPTLIDEIVATFERCVRPAFQAPPTSEKQLQLEVEKILRVLGIPFHREKERAPIGVTSFIPDFTVPECNLAIETKLAKTGHGEVAIQRELVEDCAGYRTRWTDLVAIVYDCDGTIRDPERMRQASSQLGIRLVIVKH
jgi:hypothetical protein